MLLLLLLLPLLAGCGIEEQAPAFTELEEVAPQQDVLDKDGVYPPLSPVMQDAYDRSILEDVYSAE